MKKILAIALVAAIFMAAPAAQAREAGGLAGGIVGCCFGVRTAAAWNEGKNLDIREVNAELIPSMLEDVDLGVINGNYAIGAGLKPSEDAIYLEAADGESGVIYTNYVVVRPEDADAAWVEALRTVLCSQKVADFMLTNEDYAGGVIPAFTVEEAE